MGGEGDKVPTKNMHHAPWKAENSVPALFFEKAGDKKKRKKNNKKNVSVCLKQNLLAKSKKTN